MTIRKPTATIWTLDEMTQHLIFVAEGRKVLGVQLLGLADFHGITSASRMLVDEDKEAAVSKMWFVDPRRITVGTVKGAYELRKRMPGCHEWITIDEEEDDGL